MRGWMLHRRPAPVRPLARRLARVLAAGTLTLFVLTAVQPSRSQANPAVSYVYDDGGRLVAVVDPAVGVARYRYDAVGNLLEITRHSATAVSVLEFAPKSGPAGTPLTIYGTAFGATPGENTVKFGGVTASVTAASPTRLSAVVPAGAVSGSVSVTSPAGTTTSTASFSVGSKAPTIASFTPNVGAPGASVTVTGTNFDAVANNDIATFGPTRAKVASATSTSLTAVVPGRTGSGRIGVRTQDGKVLSGGYFYVPPVPYVGTDVAATAPMAVGESRSITVAAANKVGLVIFDGTAGQRVSLKLSGVSIGTSSCCGADVSLYDPVGGPMQYSPTSFGTSGKFLEPMTLPTTGTYTILIDPRSTATGSATVTLYDVPPDSSDPIVPGTPITSTISAPGQKANYIVQASEGQRLSFRIANSTFSDGWMELFRASDDSFVALTSFSTGFIDTQTLSAGTYRLEVDPSGESTGSATVTAYEVPSDDFGPVTPGGPSVTASINTPGQNANFTFAGTIGQRITVRVESSSFTSDTVRVLAPGGAELGSSTALFGPRFIDTIEIEDEGVYTVQVDPASHYLGSATLTVHAVPADYTGTIAPGGPAVPVSTTVPGQNAALTFTGAVDQRVSVKLSASTYSSARLSLVGPAGEIASTSFSGSTGFIDTVKLTLAGEYSVKVDPYFWYTGSADVSVYDVPADLSGTVTLESALTSTIATPGQNARYAFEGAAGQRVSVRISSSSITSGTLRILGPPPGNTQLLSRGFGSFGFFIEPVTLTTAGTHTIEIDPGSQYTGSITFTLYDVPPDLSGTMTIGGPSSTLTFTAPGQNGTRTFAGTTGQTIRLDMTGVTIGTSSCCSTRVSIASPGGAPLGSATFVGTNGGSITRQLVGTGDHTITVDPQNHDTGSITLALTQTSGIAVTALQRVVDAAPAEPADAVEAAAEPKPAERPKPAPVPARVTDVPAGLAEFQPPESESWSPSAGPSGWLARRTDSPWSDLPPLTGIPGGTGLAGQVLSLRGAPITGVRLSIHGQSAVTDRTGRFVITDTPDGHHTLTIDGTPDALRRGSRDYGLYEVGVALYGGRLNVLPFTIWLPRIDHRHDVHIASPTDRAVVVTTPKIPGLEVHIPAGTVIRDAKRRPVTSVGITPIPVDRTPFPLPRGVQVPIYFTIQPGGAYLSKGARIVYPNYTHLAPGTRVSFWHYKPEHDLHEHYTPHSGWYVYGAGVVTPDGRQVVPDAGVSVREFTGAMISSPSNKNPNKKPDKGKKKGGDPVDLATGYFSYEAVDAYLPDAFPVEFRRIYGSQERGSWAFGVGTTHSFDIALTSANLYQEADVVMPDGGRIHFVRTSPGNSYVGAVFEPEATPSEFYKSRIEWNGHGWDLTLQDGTVYVFGDTAPLHTVRDRHGNEITISRAGVNEFNSPTGNITQITSDSGRWVKFTYDTSNRIIRAEDNTGRATTYQYDSSGRLWKVTNPAGGITEYTYDTASGGTHRLLKIKDPRGNVFLTNQYDTSNRVVKQTQIDGSTYLFAYTLTNGKITQTDLTDPRGNVRRVTFDSSGYVTSDTQALGKPEQQRTTYERDPVSTLVSSETDQLGRKTAYTYDAVGNVRSVTRLAGTAEAVTTSFTYDLRFNKLASVTDPLEHTTSFEYDAKSNLAAVTDPLLKRTTFTYEADGQLATATDPLDHTTRYTYELGDLTSTTDPLDRTTRHFVDAAGRVVSVTDPVGSRARTEYDALDRVTKVVDGTGNATSFAYDGNGNLTTVTDARGKVNTYAYDTMDRLISRKDPLLRTETYTYDLAGNLTKFTDRRAKITTFAYDGLDRRTFAGFGAIIPKNGPTTYESTISYSYDGANRLRQAADSAYGTVARTYDGFDRLASETSPQGSVSYVYDVAGRRTEMTAAGQAPVTYDYDVADRLTRVTRGAANVGIAYDDAGRRTRVTLPNGVVLAYAYDAASQPTRIGYELGDTVVGDVVYAYDADGSRVEAGGTLGRPNVPAAAPLATYDAANQATSANGATLTYDKNGNLATEGGATLTWNARNELASVARTGVSASFQYDPFGRRAKKTIDGAATQFLYDATTPVQEQSGSGTPTANLLTGLDVDEVFTRTDASGTSSLLTDALGSTVALTDAAGSVSSQYAYEPFGKTVVSGAASANAFQYTGRENDGATGLYFYRARYLSPGLGRFVSEDPLGFGGGDPNMYAYAFNSPTTLTDPTGCRARGILAAIPRPSPGKKPTKTVPRRISRETMRRLGECLYRQFGKDCTEGLDWCWEHQDKFVPYDDTFLKWCVMIQCGIRPRNFKTVWECWQYAKQYGRNG